MAVAGAAVVGVLALQAYRTVDARYRLEAFGVRTVATVLDVLQPRMNMVVNNVYIKRTLLVDVTLPGTLERYEAKVSGLFEFGTVPNAGAQVGVIVDSERPGRLVLDTSRPARRRAQRQRQPFVEELERLAVMHRNGDLTDAEYDAAKRRLLGH